MRLRRLSRQLRRIRPWVKRALDLLDVADWKAWIWYGLLGIERITNKLLVWAKRTTDCPAEVVLRHGKFYIAPLGESARARARHKARTSPRAPVDV